MDSKTRKELHRLQKQMVTASGIKKSALPIIHSVFVQTDGSGMRGTNLDCWFDVHCGDAGDEALLNAEQAIAYQGSAFKVDGQQAVFESGATLPIGNADDYPAPPGDRFGERWYSQSDYWSPFRKALAFVAPSKSMDLTRIALCGVMMDGKRMVATDGHTLRSHSCLRRDDWGDREVILEPSLIAMLLKLPAREGANMRMDVFENGIRIEVSYPSGIWATFAARHVEGPYPNVDQVIPKRTKGSITMTRTALLDQLKLAKPAWSKVTQGVRFELKGEALVLSCDDRNYGNKFETALTAVGDMHEPFQVNGGYLTSIAKAFDGDTIGFNFQEQNTSGSAIMIYDSTDVEPQPFALLMPLRLDS